MAILTSRWHQGVGAGTTWAGEQELMDLCVPYVTCMLGLPTFAPLAWVAGAQPSFAQRLGIAHDLCATGGRRSHESRARFLHEFETSRGLSAPR